MPMSDKEQMQIVKAWWKEYGYYILFSVLFVMVANFGWHRWQQHQSIRLERSSMIYMQMLNLSDQQKNDEAKLIGELLIKDYSKSPYASLAALILAKDAVRVGDLKLADERLQFVIKMAPSKKLRQLARIRAARVLMAMKKSHEAIDLLASVDDNSYAFLVDEVLGDALLEAGKVGDAEKSYRKAQNIGANMMPQSPLLKMKMQQF